MAINVSTADLESLMKIPGVGEVKAKQIVEMRGEGPKDFITLSQLEMISGVNWRDLEAKNIITTWTPSGGDGVGGEGNLSGAGATAPSTGLGSGLQSEKYVEQLWGQAGKGGQYGEGRSDFSYQNHGRGGSEVWGGLGKGGSMHIKVRYGGWGQTCRGGAGAPWVIS